MSVQRIITVFTTLVTVFPVTAYAASTAAQNIGLVTTGVALGVLLAQGLPLQQGNSMCRCLRQEITNQGVRCVPNPNPKATQNCSAQDTYANQSGGGMSVLNPQSLMMIGQLVGGLVQSLGGQGASQNTGGYAAPAYQTYCGLSFTADGRALMALGCPCPDPASLPASVKPPNNCPSSVSNTLLSGTTTDPLIVEKQTTTLIEVPAQTSVTNTTKNASDELGSVETETGETVVREGTSTAQGGAFVGTTNVAPSQQKTISLQGLREQVTTYAVKTAKSAMTFVAQNKNEDENKTMSGFYGGGSESTLQAQGLMGSLCTKRPWAQGVMAQVFAPSFFDDLCVRYGFGGYSAVASTAYDESKAAAEVAAKAQAAKEVVKTVAPPKTIEKGLQCSSAIVQAGKPLTLTWSCGTSTLSGVQGFTVGAASTSATLKPQSNATYGITCADSFTASCAVTVIHPKASIWANPPSVRLGTRTAIYWYSKDMRECAVAGPQFKGSGVTGGASTVGITEASTYTLTCVALDGATSTVKVTVDLAM